MRKGVNKVDLFILLRLFVILLGILLAAHLSAGSRLGKVTGIMGEVIRVNLGRLHGVSQGMRGKVFKFDKDKKTVDIAKIQVIGITDENCMARVIEKADTVEVGQFVDIEGTLGPRTLEKVDVLKELEENARNYYAANQYTEPEHANCLEMCQEILARDPENRLARELKKQMVLNYYTWAERERAEGRFSYAIIYYDRILHIDPADERATENMWEVIDLIDAEAQIPLETITKNRPPDYYYAVAEQYFRNGQYDKSKKYYLYLLETLLPDDLASLDGIKKNDQMLRLINALRVKRIELAKQILADEQKKQEDEREKRLKLERARYYKVVAEDLFQKKDYTGALVYYLKLLDILPDDSVALNRRNYISTTDMVLIPAGEFSRGSSSRELTEVMIDFGQNSMLYREIPKNWVILDSFYIDRYEVTNIQYKHFLESTGHSPPIGWKNDTYPEGEDNFPVVFVSCLDANAYARWIGRRLPREDEWEKAARGADGYQWPWGDKFYAHRCNTREGGKNKTMPVGSYLNGANAFGVLDLAGNVWEWVDADMKPYPGFSEETYYFPSSIRKILRGGSFKETGEQARGAFRGDGAVDQIYNNVGFRCTKDLTGKRENP